MTSSEQQIVDGLCRRVSDEVSSAQRDGWSWEERVGTATALLRAIHDAWWARHRSEPEGHANDVARINEILGLVGSDVQVAHAPDGQLLPPKFFGGDPRRLSPRFVVSVSLNHSLPSSDTFAEELAHFQAVDTCWTAHLLYFRQPYANWRFFQRRGKVLDAYARARGEPEVPEGWRALNQQYALYVETLPTFSSHFAATIDTARWDALRDVFVIALNEVARRIPVELLRAERVLLAGQASWGCVPPNAPQPHAMGLGVSTDRVVLPGGAAARVVRCNFLGRGGPNADAELARLGRLLAAEDAALEVGGRATTPELPADESGVGASDDEEAWFAPGAAADRSEVSEGDILQALARYGLVNDLQNKNWIGASGARGRYVWWPRAGVRKRCLHLGSYSVDTPLTRPIINGRVRAELAFRGAPRQVALQALDAAVRALAVT